MWRLPGWVRQAATTASIPWRASSPTSTGPSSVIAVFVSAVPSHVGFIVSGSPRHELSLTPIEHDSRTPVAELKPHIVARRGSLNRNAMSPRELDCVVYRCARLSERDFERGDLIGSDRARVRCKLVVQSHVPVVRCACAVNYARKDKAKRRGPEGGQARG